MFLAFLAFWVENTKNAKNRLFFRSPTRFLIQIFFIGPEILCSLWKYKISRHWCSLLLVTRHFQSFYTIFRSHNSQKVVWHQLKMTSNEQQWVAMTRNDILWQNTMYFRYSGRILNQESISSTEICRKWWKTPKNAKKLNFSFITKNVPENWNFSKSSFSEFRRDFWFKSFLLD